jgi:multidrug efflux pump subunit AcrA (membrane-fusion protein)
MPIAAALNSCSDSAASPSPETESAPENGAQYKEGKGVTLTPLMAQSIQLQTAEVQEEVIAHSYSATLQATQIGSEASGWLTEEQASQVQTGMIVELGTTKGRVLRMEKSPFVALGDYEVIVTTDEILHPGAALTATFRFPAGDAVTSIPKSALLTTAEGTFVYAENDEYFLRTPVQVGAINEDHVEIIDGLYTGDVVVTTPVMSLWLAELQILRGGKACTCGH